MPSKLEALPNTRENLDEDYLLFSKLTEELASLKGNECVKQPPDDQVLYLDLDGDGQDEEILQSSSCLGMENPRDVLAVNHIGPKGEKVRIPSSDALKKKIPRTFGSAKLEQKGDLLIESIPIYSEKLEKSKYSVPSSTLQITYRMEQGKLLLIKMEERPTTYNTNGNAHESLTNRLR